VLTTQVAHWNAASSDVVEMTARHEKQLGKLQKSFQKRLRQSLDEVLSGAVHLVNVLVQSLQEMLLGTMTDIKFDSILAASGRIDIYDRYRVNMLAESLANSPVRNKAADEIIIPVTADSPSISKSVTPAGQRSNDDDAAANCDTSGIMTRQQREALLAATVANNDKEFFGRAYIIGVGNENKSEGEVQRPEALRGAPDKASLSDTFMARLHAITALLASLQDMCGDTGMRRNRFAHRSAESTKGDHGTDDREDSAALVSGTDDESRASTAQLQNAKDSDDEHGMVSTSQAQSQSQDAAKEVVEKMRGLSKEIQPMMLGWVKDVLESLHSHSQVERAVYLRGLHLADAEAQILNKRMRSLFRKIAELEAKLVDSRLSGEGATPDSFPLHEQITTLQTELDRMRDDSSHNILHKIDEEVTEYMKANEIEQAMKYQLFKMRAIVRQEDDALSSHHLQSAEIKAVQHRRQRLLKQISEYEDRLIAVKAGKVEAKEGIISDIAIFQNCLNKVVPGDVIRKLLTWNTAHDGEMRRKDAAAEEILRLSPTHMKDKGRQSHSGGREVPAENWDEDASVRSSTSSIASTGTPSGISLSMKSDFLESAQRSLSLPSHRVKFGMTGSMPPAPTKSLFNVNNLSAAKSSKNISFAKPRPTAIISPYSPAAFTSSSSSSSLPGPTSIAVALPVSLPNSSSSGEQSARLKPRLRPLRGTNSSSTRMDPQQVQRGGIVAPVPSSDGVPPMNRISVPAVSASGSPNRPGSAHGVIVDSP
jgi:hypothetical protein